MEYEFEKRLKKIISNCGYEIDASQINMKSDLVRDFDFTSINLIELVVEVESEFDIEFDDDDLVFSIITSYGELVKKVNDKIGEKMC